MVIATPQLLFLNLLSWWWLIHSQPIGSHVGNEEYKFVVWVHPTFIHTHTKFMAITAIWFFYIVFLSCSGQCALSVPRKFFLGNNCLAIHIYTQTHRVDTHTVITVQFTLLSIWLATSDGSDLCVFYFYSNDIDKQTKNKNSYFGLLNRKEFTVPFLLRTKTRDAAGALRLTRVSMCVWATQRHIRPCDDGHLFDVDEQLGSAA